MKIAAILRSSPASFPCVFAKLRLKSLPFSPNQCLLFHHREFSAGRMFSARPARSGTRDIQRGKLRTGSVLGQSKSLIEDEAELSDWISDLKADSFRTRHSSEDEGSGRYRGRQEGKDMDRSLLASKERGRDSRSAAYGRPSLRRNRDSDSDGYSARSQRGSSLRRRVVSDDNVDDIRSRMGNGRGSRPGVSSDSRKGLGDRHGASSAFNKRGRGDHEIGGRVSQRKKSEVLVVSEEEEEEEEEESDDILSDFDDDFFGDKEDRKDRVAKGPIEKGSSRLSNDSNIVKAVPQTSVPASDSYLSEARFDQFSLSPLSLKGIKAVGYERMTVVQEATLPVILKGYYKERIRASASLLLQEASVLVSRGA